MNETLIGQLAALMAHFDVDEKKLDEELSRPITIWDALELMDLQLDRVEDKLDRIIKLIDKPKKTCKESASDYSPEFEELWGIYPKRAGSNPKRTAYHAYQARIKNGESFSVIRDGVVAYRAYCDAKGDTNTEFVMQCVRFFGVSHEYLNEWIPPAPKAVMPRSDAEWLAIGKQKGIEPRVGEDWRNFQDRLRSAL